MRVPYYFSVYLYCATVPCNNIILIQKAKDFWRVSIRNQFICIHLLIAVINQFLAELYFEIHYDSFVEIVKSHILFHCLVKPILSF